MNKLNPCFALAPPNANRLIHYFTSSVALEMQKLALKPFYLLSITSTAAIQQFSSLQQHLLL
jgi:hypothetical protein